MTRLGINGFGCNGRLVFRAALQHQPDVEVVAINDLLPVDELAYQLQYDSVHGSFKGTVTPGEGCLVVHGRRVPVACLQDPGPELWRGAQAEVVVECTGRPVTVEIRDAHHRAGVGRVIQGPGPQPLTLATFSLPDLLRATLSLAIPASRVQSLLLVCESGIGSSLMTVNQLKKKLQAAGITGIAVERTAFREMPPDARVVVVHKRLAEKVRARAHDAVVLTYTHPLNDPAFDQLVRSLASGADIATTH
jgi:galactitol-specific phosphotransferase system IIB component